MESVSSSEVEEGEIVDDDFEDISDNSIIDSTFGKFVSSNANLRALSLSSDNDIVHNNKKYKKKLPRKNRKKRKRPKSSSESSNDSEISTCPDLKGKLKEAVHINNVDDCKKKPLETRLKAMWTITTNRNQESVITQPTNNIENSDKIDDHELEKLRIEALKTAVLNKFQRRKRKKAILEEEKKELEQVKTLENKENFEKNTTLDLEEDEDVLRASLLAGLAKKITKTSEDQQQIPTLPSQVVSKIPPVFNNNKKIIQTRPKPQVKPLIININEDSDSEEEPRAKPLSKIKNNDLNVISSNVEKFLKEQRAKFEIETKKRFQIVHNNKNKSILEKSAVKLLPKSQQIEYQQLLRKLKIAERRKRAKKIALEKKKQENVDSVTMETMTTKPQPVSVVTEVEKKTTDQVVMTTAVQQEVETKPLHETEENGDNSKNYRKKSGGITSELTILQKTLKEIKMQRNGSLQIKSKYQVLTPIIRKITAMSNERKKQEQRIKNLLEDLDEARKNLAQSHRKFSALVKELVDTKDNIDTKSNIETKNGSMATSTPIKQKQDVAMATAVTTNDYEDMDVCSNSDEADFCQIDIVDPNDIDQIFTRKSIDKLSMMPEYVSPLNLNTYERYRHVDPHGIMCPYEVNGLCRDIDCTFKHYLKNSVKLK